MKTIDCWDDLRPFGIVALTGEKCGSGYQVLADLTDAGRKIVEKCLGLPTLALAEASNPGTAEVAHVGSIRLTPPMFVPIGVFALLETGCTECWLYENGVLRGVEVGDGAEHLEWARRRPPAQFVQRFKYYGTGQDKIVGVTSGRMC